jgi:hypothetical protein
MSRDDETHGPVFGGSNDLLSERQGNPFIFIPFCNMNLLISLHSIFQDEESFGREEEVEAARLEEEVEVAGLEETFDRGHDTKEEEEGHKEGRGEGHEEAAGLDDEGVWVMGLLQDLHPHTDFGVATSFALF